MSASLDEYVANPKAVKAALRQIQEFADTQAQQQSYQDFFITLSDGTGSWLQFAIHSVSEKSLFHSGETNSVSYEFWGARRPTDDVISETRDLFTYEFDKLIGLWTIKMTQSQFRDADGIELAVHWLLQEWQTVNLEFDDKDSLGRFEADHETFLPRKLKKAQRKLKNAQESRVAKKEVAPKAPKKVGKVARRAAIVAPVFIPNPAAIQSFAEQDEEPNFDFF